MTQKTLAPIALFTYKRLSHTKQTIDALRKNKHASESIIYIFSDGAKDKTDKSKILAVRNYLLAVKKKQYFKNVTIVEAKKNKGLAQSIIDGVTTIVKKYGKIIVLEDDIITNRYFLDYMNKALDMYENEEKVISIHGYNYPIKNSRNYFFAKGPGTRVWGWATWARGWALFEKNGKKLITALEEKKKVKEFNFNDSYDYYDMLRGQIIGNNNSWAIRWYASGFLKNKLTLYPGHSLTQNIGFGPGATHTSYYKINPYYHHDFDAISPPPKLKKIFTIENKRVRRKKIKFFLHSNIYPVKIYPKNYHTSLKVRLHYFYVTQILHICDAYKVVSLFFINFYVTKILYAYIKIIYFVPNFLPNLYMTKLQFLHKPWRAFKKIIGIGKK